jgi:putative membrane protein
MNIDNDTTVSVNKPNETKYKRIAIGLSISLPIAVAALFGINIDGIDFSFLPPIYATTNGLTAITLIGAYIAIKNKKKKLHQNLINVAVSFSLAFLVMYVAYHITSNSTEFGGEGAIKYVYYFILISHIILSVIITPFVCFTYLRGWLGDYEKHKKLTRITFPLWLYVAITGVVVYLMISPYYS